MKVQVGSHWMLLHPGDNHTESFMWRRGQRAEAASIGRLTLLVAGKRSLIFDVGANCGAYSLALATSAGPGSRVVAFEPSPVMASRLRVNLELNDMSECVELKEVAVGDEDGTAHLHLDQSNLGASTLFTGPSRGSVPVAVRRLCNYLPEDRQSYRMFVVKIDVEGYEDRVLMPFLESIAWNDMPDAILMETRHVDNWSINPMTLLTQKGYSTLFEGEDHNTLFLRPEVFRRHNED